MLWLVTRWRLVAAGTGLALAAGAVWIVVDRIKESGRREVQTQVDTLNQGAADAARRAREDHDHDCARGRAGCLSDGWTRDGTR